MTTKQGLVKKNSSYASKQGASALVQGARGVDDDSVREHRS
jgi:hypothetical protein